MKLIKVRLNGWKEKTDSEPIINGIKYKVKNRLFK